MEEKFLQQEEQKEEKYYQRRPHICGLFFYKNLGEKRENENMKFSESLKKNRDFQAVYRAGKSFGNKYLVMYLLKNDLGKNRVGISVSKKVGNSIVRHHLTRLIRESYRLQEEKFQCGYDLVIIARNAAKDRSYREIESALIHLGKLHNIVYKSSVNEAAGNQTVSD